MPSAYVQTRVTKDGKKRYRAVLERSYKGNRLPRECGPWGPYWKKANQQREQMLASAYDRKMGLHTAAETHLLSELVEEYRRARSGLRPKTREADEGMIAVVEKAWGTVELHAITKATVVRLREDLRQRLADGSVGIRLRSLKTMLYYAVDELGWLTVHPMSGVSIPESPDRERVYSDDEFWASIAKAEKAPAAIRGALLLARTRAFRKGELLMLGEEGSKRYLWRDQDGDWWLRLRKPGRLGIKSQRDLKTKKKGERDVHVPAEALPYLDVEGTDGPVLPGLTEYRLRYWWRKIREGAQLDGRWHDWKHTAVTRLLEEGAGKQNVLDLTGNTPESLERYDHAMRRAPKEALRKGFPSKSPPTEQKKKADAGAPADSSTEKVVGASGLEPEASCSQSMAAGSEPPTGQPVSGVCSSCGAPTLSGRFRPVSADLETGHPPKSPPRDR